MADTKQEIDQASTKEAQGEGTSKDNKDSVDMKKFHFTNGDWFEKEKAKPVVERLDDEVPKEGSGENLNQFDDSDDDRRSVESEDEYGSDGQKLSYFDKLLREVAKIKHTPEENWERRNEGHRERNKMLMEGIKSNHRDWIYLVEERYALEAMYEEKKARLEMKKKQIEERLSREAEEQHGDGGSAVC